LYGAFNGRWEFIKRADVTDVSKLKGQMLNLEAEFDEIVSGISGVDRGFSVRGVGEMAIALFTKEFRTVYQTLKYIDEDLESLAADDENKKDIRDPKVVFASIQSVITGLGLGDNARAGLMTRGLAEMARFGMAFGADMKTFMGLCGIGDLIVTCTSKLSRNYQAGQKIARGIDIYQTLESMPMVVEGARTCISAYQAASYLGVDVPIINSIYNVVYLGKNPIDEIKQLMSRTLKGE
jgi:hypothetical protein